MLVGLATAALFALHLEFRAPNGWLESALAAMFVALVASGLAGVLLQLGLRGGAIDAEETGPLLVRRWLFVHVPLSASVLSLGLLHGVLVHAHGFLAHLVSGS